MTPPLDLDRIARDLAAWTAQGDMGPLTRSPGVRALLRTAVALLRIAQAAQGVLAWRSDDPHGADALDALRAAVEGRAMHATPPLGTHGRDCHADAAPRVRGGPARVAGGPMSADGRGDDVSLPVSAQEVAEQLRRAVRGAVLVSLADPRITWAALGDVAFRIGDWTVTFFNDCGCLDYCDSAVAPDGRRGRFADWYGAGPDSGPNPAWGLTAAEDEELERLLWAAR